jgi:hypothetical protein
MTNVTDLFSHWQESIEKAQFAEENISKDDELEQEHLCEVAGLHVRSGIFAGQLFSLLTICRCED